MSLRKTICDAIQFDNRSLKSISASLDIPLPTLSRYVNEKRGMQYDYLEKLCEHLNLDLRREIADFDAYCRYEFEHGGREMITEELELSKDGKWEEYLEENWERDETAFDEYIKREWKDFARVEWPEFAEERDLDVTDGDESAHWKDTVYAEWLSEKEELWDEQSKEEWTDMEYENWSSDFDDKLDDDEYLYELFFDKFRQAVVNESWITIKG